MDSELLAILRDIRDDLNRIADALEAENDQGPTQVMDDEDMG